MPKKAAAERGEQLATLKRLSHELLTHAETGEQLAAAEAEADLDPWQQANLREMRRKYRHAHALEPALVEALARATTACEMTWREARAQSDFAMLAPQLTEVVRLVRETAAVTGAALGLSAPTTRCSTRTSRTCATPRSCRCSIAWRPSCRRWSRRSWPARPQRRRPSGRPGRSRPRGRRSSAGR